MLDPQRALRSAAVGGGVGFLLADLVGADDHAVLDRMLVSRSGGSADFRLDFGAEIDGVSDQPLVVGRHVLDAGVAGVGRAFEDGDRPLHQVQAAVFFTFKPSIGNFGWTSGL